MADTKMFWGRSDKSKMFDEQVFNQRFELIKYGQEQNFTYPEFQQYCTDNGHNFSVITTVMNIFGMIELNDSERLEKNSFFDMLDSSFLNIYLEYYLSYWQHAEGETVVKPYLLILKLLKQIKEKGENPYLSEYEFTETFKEFKSYDDINDSLVNDIISKRTTPQNNQYGNLGYSTKAYLQFSSLLSFDKTGKEDGFFVGLNDDEMVNQQIESLLSSQIKDDIFKTEASGVKNKNTEWGKFLNNEKRFHKWFITFSIYEFKNYCSQKGYQFDDSLIRRFILSLETKSFLLLTGISGSGKTKIAEHYGNYLKNKSYGEKFVLAIGSNWNDGKKLLGFNNPLATDPALAYIETKLVKFFKHANENLNKIFIIILDEMNLSYTEKYFSDFLSALESLDKKISLPNGENILWSKNIKIVGTINEDETTHTISPKILDRANVIEMNGLMPSEYINMQIASDNKIYKTFAEKFNIDTYKLTLDAIYNALNGNFAFRIMNEITMYINTNTIYSSEVTLHVLLDEQVYQKLLPKIHGSKLDLPKKLNKLKNALAETGEEYELTNHKINNMLDHVSTHGYASFIMG